MASRLWRVAAIFFPKKYKKDITSDRWGVRHTPMDQKAKRLWGIIATQHFFKVKISESNFALVLANFGPSQLREIQTNGWPVDVFSVMYSKKKNVTICFESRLETISLINIKIFFWTVFMIGNCHLAFIVIKQIFFFFEKEHIWTPTIMTTWWYDLIFTGDRICAYRNDKIRSHRNPSIRRQFQQGYGKIERKKRKTQQDSDRICSHRNSSIPRQF